MDLKEELQKIENEFIAKQQETSRIKQILVQHETDLIELQGAYKRIKALSESSEKPPLVDK